MNAPQRLFADVPILSAGMSQRADGDMRLRSDGVVQDDMLFRRRSYLERQLRFRAIAAPLPVHGAAVAVVTGSELERVGHALFPGIDALVTTAPGIALTVTAADCLPVLFLDPMRRAIGIAHAGWRGLVAAAGGVIGATVDALCGLGCRPEHLRVEIGPSVGPCHYAVDAERRALFAERFGPGVVVGDALDLRRAAAVALARRGIDPARITADPPCTVCERERFFSRRADGKDPPDVGMAWIMLRE